MKFLLLLLVSFNLMAHESIVLDKASLQIPDSILKDDITLIRNATSPALVELLIPSHALQECVKKEVKQIHGESPQCGSYTVSRCENEQYDCETRTRCTMWSGFDTCAWEEFYQVCQNRIRCSDETRYLSCYHDAEVCVEYKSVPQTPRKAILKFDLKRRHARKTHELRLWLTPHNGVNIHSNDLSVEYEFNGTYVIRK